MSAPAFDPGALLPDYRASLDGVIADARSGLKILKASTKTFALVAVYLTIMKSTIEAAEALRTGTSVTIGGTVRSILESYADLCSLAKDPLYARRMLATLYKERCRLFEDMVNHPTNQYHASLAQQLDPAVELAAATQQLANEKADGFEPLDNYQRLDVAGLSNEYRSLYWQLCMESHNNIATIEQRHIDASNGDAVLVLERPTPPGTMMKYYDSLVSMLIEASILVHTQAKSPQVARWVHLQGSLRAYRTANFPTGQ
jgi:hypothetical protein